MSPRARRVVIPLLVSVPALLVLAVVIFSPGKQPAPTPPPDVTNGEVASNDDAQSPDGSEAANAADSDEQPQASDDETQDGSTAANDDDADNAGDDIDADDQPAEQVSLDGLYAKAPDAATAGTNYTPATLGSLDRREASMLVEFSTSGAGIDRLILADYWQTAASKHKADAHYAALANGVAPDQAPPLPPVEDHYIISNEPVGGVNIPMLATSALLIDGERVRIFDIARAAVAPAGASAFPPILDEDGSEMPVWSQVGPGSFRTVIHNADGTPVAQITRTYTLGDNFDLILEQAIENLAAAPVDIQWVQYGPSDLLPDRSRYIDRRRFRFGYMYPASADPTGRVLSAEDTDFILERGSVAKDATKAAQNRIAGNIDAAEYRERVTIWPNDEVRENNFDLAWFGATNRYFTLTIHPLIPEGQTVRPSLAPLVEEIRMEVDPNAEDPSVLTLMYGPTHTIEANSTFSLDIGVYGGPQERDILNKQHPLDQLQMGKLILFQMSNCCAMCTFQWLAKLLLMFLSLLHDHVVFDWGIAIIMLVLVVRGLLHPITKRTQINMQRFSKTMQKVKPEIDKLQKKFANDPKRMQMEQMRLFREQGVNPFQMLGCLPMFLQTPIWIALYAMLYAAIELRHEPAFFGIFQQIGGWPFLADLSSADHCLGEFAEPFRFLFWNITGINILPILMGGIFFVQQKYMSPPNPTATPEQLQQQRIMKIMMVVLFPVMLYSAPSGLTLYILTSSTVGIIESKYVRAHINQLDLETPPKKKKNPRKAAKRDAQARAYAAMLERRKEKQRGSKKSFKKRK